MLLAYASMQDGFLQKLMLCVVIGFLAAGMVEFYRHFVNGADDALNGRGAPVHMMTHK